MSTNTRCYRAAVAPMAGMAPADHAAVGLQHREAPRRAVADEVRTAHHGADLERSGTEGDLCVYIDMYHIDIYQKNIYMYIDRYYVYINIYIYT